MLAVARMDAVARHFATPAPTSTLAGAPWRVPCYNRMTFWPCSDCSFSMRTVFLISLPFACALAVTDSAASDHWAFQPIQHATPPENRDAGWARNDIDWFILRKLEAEDVNPWPEADRVTLLRRVFLDLIGLPPSPEEIDDFLADESEHAYDDLVQRLLKSPHYGERWGRHWLDAAHYGDSNGYESDGVRPHAWRWREWVVDAVNNDMPFDQFTIEQLAGDRLPSATLDQKIATGFQRNTLLNTEGGVDREEDRVKRTVDRTNTVGKVWLGITLGCCQCHSHKYDPFTQEEYYSFYAFFNSLIEPDIPAPTEAQTAQYNRDLAAFEVEHRKHLDAIRDYRSESLANWEQSLPKDGPYWHALKPEELSTVAGTSLVVEPDGSVFATGRNNAEDTYTIVSSTRLTGITAVRLEVISDPRLPKNGPGLASNGNFVLSTFRVFAAPNDKAKGQQIPVKAARADFSQAGRNITAALVDDPSDGWAIYPEVGKSHVAVFELANPIGDENGLRLTIELDHQRHPDHQIGRFRLSATTANGSVPLLLSNADVAKTLNTPLAERTGSQQLDLVTAFGFTEPALAKHIEAEAEHRKHAPVSPELTSKAQVISEPGQTPRETRVHERGDFLSKGDVVQRGTPAVLPPLRSRGELPDRLDLSRWLLDDANPLTSRVIVNRIWQQHFGRGLVVTDDDFGTQGETPSHPELLDRLATWFRDNGWSMKKLHHLIVTSATYRQSSVARPELAARDPYNTWLSRQNRLRVESEIVRDVALAASGLLSRKIGGPNVYPPQANDPGKLGFRSSFVWPTSKGEDRYRRGLYTFFKRTTPYPMFMTFDSPDSNTSCTHRDRSNTPLQALTLWNDPIFFECAQALARRAVTKVLSSDRPTETSRHQIRYVFRSCLSRRPTNDEQQILVRLFRDRETHYSSAEAAAAKAIGGSTALPGNVSLSELAALVSVSRAVMNLDEFITRE
jgi:hypothetical protein